MEETITFNYSTNNTKLQLQVVGWRYIYDDNYVRIRVNENLKLATMSIHGNYTKSANVNKIVVPSQTIDSAYWPRKLFTANTDVNNVFVQVDYQAQVLLHGSGSLNNSNIQCEAIWAFRQ